MTWLARAAALALPLLLLHPAAAQQLDLSHGGPIEVTALGGIDWDQNAQTVTAHGDARAVRGNVTVTADRLIAYYRKKSQATGAAATKTASSGGILAPGSTDAGSNEIYRLVAEGNVRMYTATDQAQCDRAVYDIDQAVLVMTGRNLKLTTPQDVLTARDSMEYWSQKHMAVARGDAVVVTTDGRRVSGDVLVAYTSPGSEAPAGKPVQTASADPLAASGKLQRAEVFGHVEVRTTLDVVRGDRGVYVPDTGIAVLVGNVRITRGENQLNGNEAEVNLKTGIARLLSSPGERVQGLVVPNDAGLQGPDLTGKPTPDKSGGKAPARPGGGR